MLHNGAYSGDSFSTSSQSGAGRVARIVVSCAMLIASSRSTHDVAVTPPSASGPPLQEGLSVTSCLTAFEPAPYSLRQSLTLYTRSRAGQRDGCGMTPARRMVYTTLRQEEAYADGECV